MVDAGNEQIPKREAVQIAAKKDSILNQTIPHYCIEAKVGEGGNLSRYSLIKRLVR
jgi:hypothetical protein